MLRLVFSDCSVVAGTLVYGCSFLHSGAKSTYANHPFSTRLTDSFIVSYDSAHKQSYHEKKM